MTTTGPAPSSATEILEPIGGTRFAFTLHSLPSCHYEESPRTHPRIEAIFLDTRKSTLGARLGSLLLRRVRARQRHLPQRWMRPPEIRGFGILADIDDAAADRAGASEQVEQRVAVGR